MDTKTDHSHANATRDNGAPGNGNASNQHMHDNLTQDPQAHDHDAIPTDLPKVRTGSVILVAIVVLFCFAGLFALGWFPRQHRIEQSEADARDQDARPVVDVVQPQRKSKGFDLWLPADVRAMQETPIFPRTNGYLKRWTADVGDRVKKDQLLAEIDSPEVDAQLNQSKAQLEQLKATVGKAEADLNLANVTLKRYLEAQKNSPGSVTAQDIDEKQSAYDDAASALKQAKANVVAGEADVQRLTVLQGFEKISAPFDGIITTRNYDVGQLLSSGNTAAGTELYRVQQTDTLRTFVNVPQSYITSIKLGQEAFLSVRNYAGKEFKGVIARSTGAVDPTTRTLRYEVDVPNKDGALFAGMYGQVRINVSPEAPPIVVPTSAIVFDAEGTRVGIVESDKVHFKKVTLGRDYGTEVEIASGLVGDESVISNPGLRTTEGSEVRPNNPLAADTKPKPTGHQQVSER
jgi:RND family efflux transporter MFP subunit